MGIRTALLTDVKGQERIVAHDTDALVDSEASSGEHDLCALEVCTSPDDELAWSGVSRARRHRSKRYAQSPSLSVTKNEALHSIGIGSPHD